MEEREMLIKEIEIEEAIIGIRKDGIGHVYLKSGAELNVDLQLRLLENYLILTEGKPHDFIFEAGEYVTVTKEARENAKNLEARSPVKAMAAVVSNLGYRIIAEFYYKVNKPNKPFKVVGSFQDALTWLRPQRIQAGQLPLPALPLEAKEELNNQPY